MILRTWRDYIEVQCNQPLGDVILLDNDGIPVAVSLQYGVMPGDLYKMLPREQLGPGVYTLDIGKMPLAITDWVNERYPQLSRHYTTTQDVLDALLRRA